MKQTGVTAPLIEKAVWGEIVVKGYGAFRDVKVFPGGARTWDWTETGTHHKPGIQIGDVQELVEAGCTTVVLTRGMHLVLQTQPETLDWLKEQGVTAIVEETSDAVLIYNELVTSTKPVGGLFHSTC